MYIISRIYIILSGLLVYYQFLSVYHRDYLSSIAAAARLTFRH